MLENGQTLSARFTLVRRLGAGGHAEVWLAQDRERQGFAALKVLNNNLSNDPDAVAACERAATQVSRLTHPNVLGVFGVVQVPPHIAIAMEYAPGGDASVLRGRPSQESLPLLLGVADGLLHAHAAGVAHGDLKPSNVLIGSDDLPRLTDFAAAGAGSPYNVSPQRLQGAELTPVDDVYGFGVLAYELLSGYPPFYPQPTPERVLNEPAATLVPRYPAPESLVDLIMRCLHKDPAQRPTMLDVRATLSAALEDLRRGVRVASTAGAAPPIAPPADDTLRAQWSRTPVSSAADREPGRWKRALSLGGLSVLAVAALGTFIALPRWTERSENSAVRQVQSPAATAAPERDAEPEVDYALLARQKQAAEDMRVSIDDRWESLRARAVERWAREPAQSVNEVIRDGDDLLSKRRYADALARFQSAEREVAALEAEAPRVLQANLDKGTAAIERGDGATAVAAFELALALDKENARAAAGLKRAQTLDEVLDLLANARSLEQAGQVNPALESYRKALALDPQMLAASEGVSRIETQLTNDAFGRAMARAYDAMSRSGYDEARAAFAEARKIRPQAAEVDQALAQLQQQERTGAITAHLQRATSLESEERWVEALEQLRAALKLDPTVAPALAALSRVEPRARLHEEFELYLTQPERLFAPSVRRSAQVSLQRAQSIAQPGPVLRAQVEKLSGWLQRAEQPVRVSLQSDNQTQVTIYRVGELGTFTQRSLELAPGKYTIVGTRPGYRDVRRELALVPGEPLQSPVVIRCEDPV